MLEFGLYLIPTWLTAVVLNKTAPLECPKRGWERDDCRNSHAFHVLRQNAMYCSVLGFFWPLWIIAALFFGFAKSVEVTQKIPVPTLKRPNTKNMLTAGDTEKLDKDFEALKAETDAHLAKLMQEKQAQEPIEGKIVDPGHDWRHQR